MKDIMLEHPITDVFFDLDHTLWDFERNSALTYRAIFAGFGLQVDLNAFLEIYVPANLNFWKLYREGRIGSAELRYQRLRTVFDQLGVPIEDTQIHEVSVAYIEQLSGHTHLVPDAIEILEYLRGKYHLHIITNGFREVQLRKLKNSRISGYFSEVVHAEGAGARKPDARIFRLALERAGVQPSRAVMIGDSLEADIQGARAVGLQTIHFNVHGDPNHGYGPVIRALREIKTYL